MSARRVLIMGAAGRDFHNFNLCFRDNPAFEVVGFTATQIPNITGRRYPGQLAGSRYPDGIPIRPEEELLELIVRLGVEQVVFAYSDVSGAYVEERRRRVEAAGASFATYDVDACMLRAKKPVIAVCAVRTAIFQALGVLAATTWGFGLSRPSLRSLSLSSLPSARPRRR